MPEHFPATRTNRFRDRQVKIVGPKSSTVEIGVAVTIQVSLPWRRPVRFRHTIAAMSISRSGPAEIVVQRFPAAVLRVIPAVVHEVKHPSVAGYSGSGSLKSSAALDAHIRQVGREAVPISNRVAVTVKSKKVAAMKSYVPESLLLRDSQTRACQ